MLEALRARILPDAQRRTLAELTADLDLAEGDVQSKRSAFWTMLVLSAVIASAGVLSDSTATVIGAMIIAPLSTPIMGLGLSLVKRERLGGGRYVLFGAITVIGIGVVFSLFLPGSYDLLDNSQIASRTSPGLLDLVAAVATGLAGATALARRDVSAVLPGVAIAISLVPPLAVVGLCLGQGAELLAVGALLLFLSNLLAMVLAGTFVFTALGYTSEAIEESGRRRRRAYVVLGGLVFVVSTPLVANTVATYLYGVWEGRVDRAAREWVSEVPDAEVTGVQHTTSTFYIDVQTPRELPPTSELLSAIDDEVPDGFEVVVETTTGEKITVGTTGG